MTKRDKKLKWLAERGLEHEAFALSSELLAIGESLDNSLPFLPEWQTLLKLSGQLEQFARHLEFLKSLDKSGKGQ